MWSALYMRGWGYQTGFLGNIKFETCAIDRCPFGCKPFLALITGVLLVLMPGTAGAQSICESEVASCDLQTDSACLEKTYACGEYDTIVATLFVEDIAPTLDHKFYLGASFYGKYLRERSLGAECEMVRQGRQKLFDYLTAVQGEFNRAGSFGNVRQMRQIYFATQMYDRLNAVSGCPQSALTRARIQMIARAEALDYGSNVFLDPPPAVSDAFLTMQNALRGFVSKASDLETGIALREVELDAATARLAAIRGLFEEVFGAVSGAGAALSVDTGVLDDLTVTTSTWKRRVEVEHGNFSQALNGISVEDYARIRSETIDIADRFMKASSFHINMIGELMPTDPANPFPQLEEALNAEGPGKSLRDDLATIRSDWRAFGDRTGLCVQTGAAASLWYCR